MKKFICIILSMIIVFSAFSVTSFASYTPKAEEALKNIDFENGVSMAITHKTDKTNLIVKGNKLIGEVSIEGIDLKLIIIDSTAYIYFKAFPFFYYKSDIEIPFSTDDFMLVTFDANFETVYQKDIDGVTYSVEKYIYEGDSVIEFYFLDDELKIIDSSGYNEFPTKLEIISTEIDDKEFRPPFFSINITPIINFFFGI